MKISLNKLLPYSVAIIVFVLVSVIYFSPVLEGKKIQQSDITQFIGSSKEIVDYRKANNQEPYWTNATFGGMPSYVVSAYYPNDYIKKLDKLIRFLPRPADYLFLYFLSFFVLLMVLKVEWKLAIVGSLGFGLSTYLIIILGVGHNAKAHAIAYMPLVLSGILLVFQRKYLVGFVLTALAMALEIGASHIQMTYYLLFLVLIFGVVQLIETYKKKEFPHFIKSISVLIVAVILGVGVNATSLMATQEYAKQSIRGKSELTITPDGKEKVPAEGLSKDYITEYSYGKLETFNLFIPRFMGGTRYEEIKDSELQSFLQQSVNKGLQPNDANYIMQISSMYWGEQPIVAAPAYIGALFIFLFVLAIFLVKGKLKYWLVGATTFSILMSWGHNLEWLTNFFIEYIPLYNKFRAVSSIQVIAEVTIPLLAILGLNELLKKEISNEVKLKALKNTVYIVGGLALLFVIGGSSFFAFETPLDNQINEQLPGYLDAITTDRKSLFFEDSLRTLIIVLVAAGSVFFYIKGKLKPILLIGIIGATILFDLVDVDKRYVNDSNFVSARKVDKPFVASAIDKEILKDKSYYRVADLTKDLMADGTTSYFHKSLGGYHAAKPRRYQELYNFHLAKGNPEVFNMLNTKYIISSNEKGEKTYDLNTSANGNVWFVEELKLVSNANQEIKALDSTNTKKVAIINSNSISSNIAKNYELDSTAVIKLTNYSANKLTYKSAASKKQFAVFSDIYYKNGWNAYIDGELKPHYQVNYVLRGMEIPKGNHTIEFKFEPTVISTGNTITLISYALFLIIPFGWFFIKKKKKTNL
ncbi:YfhO family protein [Lutibacter sp. TH_r2]|uniref:YfhO family protein n=1 Tax=Lutibacter sp. TH_r2 TaxID=3082083 RepID=UPI00295400C6|nr:YfhO family protein [Lutibacter sp. TH_r2]MDV7185654.1 YfhO family protein [Lutibacter sp. TH_r2]